MDTGGNATGEFLLAVVDGRRVLHQFCGTDDEIAQELIEIAQTGTSRALDLLRAEKARELSEARERGDTPEMPRHTAWSGKPERRHDGPGPSIPAAANVPVVD